MNHRTLNTVREILIVATFCSGLVAFINANCAHISFKSVDHGINWCEAHKGDWRERVNGRVLEAAKRIDARYASK